MRTILFVFLFIYIHMTCAMQESKHHHHHHHKVSQELESVYIEKVLESAKALEREASAEKELLRYRHKKKLAIIGLCTAIIAGGTAVVVIFTK